MAFPATTSTFDVESFGHQLRKLRKRKGLSQRQLAEALDVSQGIISHWERRADAPRGAILKMLAQFFGVDRMYFLKHNPEMNWQKKRVLIAGYIESLAERIKNMPDRPRRPPLNGKTYTLFDNLVSWYGEIDLELQGEWDF